jgi:ParB-like chromosome segregation protein Spo0J
MKNSAFHSRAYVDVLCSDGSRFTKTMPSKIGMTAWQERKEKWKNIPTPALNEQKPLTNGGETMKNIEYHPYCLLFPPCTEAELQTLTEDIKQNGLLEPIVLLGEKILDGRNRYLACLQSGAELKTIEFTGDDPLAYVLSKNLHRRHLNESQRAMIASEIANLQHGGNNKKQSLNSGFANPLQHKELRQKQKNGLSKNLSKVSQTEAAKMLNVSRDSIQKASKLRKEASPKIIQQIKEGKKTIHAALSEKKSKPQKKTIVAKEPENQSSVTIKWQDLQSAAIDLPLSDDAEYTFEMICQALGFRSNDFPRRKELAETLEVLGNELEKLANWIRTIAD